MNFIKMLILGAGLIFLVLGVLMFIYPPKDSSAEIILGWFIIPGVLLSGFAMVIDKTIKN